MPQSAPSRSEINVSTLPAGPSSLQQHVTIAGFPRPRCCWHVTTITQPACQSGRIYRISCCRSILLDAGCMPLPAAGVGKNDRYEGQYGARDDGHWTGRQRREALGSAGALQPRRKWQCWHAFPLYTDPQRWPSCPQNSSMATQSSAASSLEVHYFTSDKLFPGIGTVTSAQTS